MSSVIGLLIVLIIGLPQWVVNLTGQREISKGRMCSGTAIKGVLLKGKINFCQECGHTLSERDIQGKARPYCVNCGYIVYLDPKVAAVVLVSVDGKLVLVQRDIEPAIGEWAFPSGYIDRGEKVEAGAIREVKEETGLVVEIDGFVGVYSDIRSPVILVVYSARSVGGHMVAGDEVRDVALFFPDELPPLPFRHDKQMLHDWRVLTRD